ncbi:RNA polymerase [Aneurinibacillus migulanus]|uniref:RNA polymerase sigma factor n=1 Tax=Aneurinibacillus migulanus TaxID=47500 RepID=UPI0005BCC2B8|nr:sigma-70 family RNA polymerase sigma factor [Aneurinibacillus migulanus]KIV51334.1 RNA polymerase [Aneurinibacillus migulanus]KPD08333.1 RNA polymerase [Aneurinibacillus migulanus]CEH31493.1 RNA polymerase sigma factor [Aneurinibacillus migulanus]
MSSDQELVELVLQGNKQAYNQIVDRYKGKIYSFLYGMIGRPQDAQDLAQEVFIKAYFHIQSYKPDYSFSSWLYRIATNHCLDELRKQKRVPYISQENGSHEENSFVHHRTPESIYLEKERNAVLHKYIMELDENYRTVLVLRHIEHLSYKEISHILGVPVTTVQMRLYRVHKKLRKLLKITEKGGIDHDMCEI